MKLSDRIIQWTANRAPDLYIGGKTDPYMIRWFLIPRNKYFNIYIHNFHRSDEDRALHDHPWPFNFSWLMKGSYREHLPGGVYRDVEEGEKKLRIGWAAHRIELYPDCAGKPRRVWTLFVTGPVVRTWGFYCPQGWRPWQKFLNVSEGESKMSAGCD